MEQLRENGFDATYALVMVNDRNFYSGKKTDGIYAYFRGGAMLQGTVEKPTGKKEEAVTLHKKHSIHWEGKTEHWKYYIADINEGR